MNIILYGAVFLIISSLWDNWGKSGRKIKKKNKSHMSSTVLSWCIYHGVNRIQDFGTKYVYK